MQTTRFHLRPAVCRTEYPLGGGAHRLYVSVTESGPDHDGHLAYSRDDERVGYYITHNENGWFAQRVQGGVASNAFIISKSPTRAGLLARLPTRANASGYLLPATEVAR